MQDRDKLSLQKVYLPENNKNIIHSKSQKNNSSMKSIDNIKHTDQDPLHTI